HYHAGDDRQAVQGYHGSALQADHGAAMRVAAGAAPRSQDGRYCTDEAGVALPSIQRKLAAIFSADVQGYSRLMGDDEVATVRTLTAYREVMATHIQAHRGRVVDSPGGNL